MASIERVESPAAASPQPARGPADTLDNDEVELEALRARRECAFARSQQADPQGLPRVGLALSGGGVRSATFAIGLVRGLAKGGLLNRLDYLSTVSGGGYAGSLLGRLIDRIGLEQAQKELADDRSAVLDWVRRNGRYLTPAGSRDYGIAAVTYLRALLAIHTEAMFACVFLGLLVIAPHLWFYSTQRMAVDQWQAWYTPWWAWAVVAWAAVAPALIGAYWTARESQPLSWRDLALAAAFGAGAAALFAKGDPRFFLDLGIAAPDLVSLGAVAMASLSLGMVVLWFWLHRRGEAQHAHWVAVARNNLTRYLKQVSVGVWGLAGLGVLDLSSWWILESIYSNQGDLLWGGLSFGGLVVLVLRVLAQPLQQMATDAGTRVRQWLPRLVNATGWVGLVILVMAWLVVLQWLVFSPDAFEGDPPPWLRAAVVFGVWALWVGLTSGNFHMANGSSLHSFYRARLVRAYLAVGNARRGLGRDPASEAIEPLPSDQANDVTRVVDGDDIAMAQYRPHTRGGPLHLVNTCLNQTRDSDTLLYNADRKGVPLAVSPFGIEFESEPGRVVRVPLTQAPEVGTLGRWAAISGAAASPGAGSYTSRGLALLLYFLGVRLGHWVRAVGPETRLRWLSAFGWRRMPKVLMLTSEATAMFFGRERPWWYLSDGGHFENTGVYPLLRRELDFIILSDASCDPRFEFADLENLVRKARIDLGCEIDFYSQEAVDQALPELKGTLGVLPPEAIGDQVSRRGVMLARIRYRSRGSGPRKQGTLLVVKPALHQALDVDLIGYARANPDFPHESTGDQSFDEAQWESYHRLGCDFGRALSNTWLSDIPGWQRAAQHRDGLSTARLSTKRGPAPAANKDGAAPVPLWRRSTRAAIGTTLGLGASGTLLLSLWQLQDQLQRNVQDSQRQARELFTLVSTELSGFNGACPRVKDHVVDQALRLFAINPDALATPERSGIARLRDRLRSQCGRALDADQACVDAWNTIGRELCGQIDRGSGGANLALAYWSPRSAPWEQQLMAQAFWDSWRLSPGGTQEQVALAPAEPEPAALPAPVPASPPTDPAEGTTGAAAPAPQGAATPDPDTAPAAAAAAAALPVPPPPTVTATADPQPAQQSAQQSAQQPAQQPAQPAGNDDTAARGDTQAARLREACSTFEFADGTPTLYIQIYQESTRESADALRATLREVAGHQLRIVPVENANQAAAMSGQAYPVPWPRATVLVFDQRSAPCAQAVAGYVTSSAYNTGAFSQALVRAAPASVKAQPGTIELWLPPRRSTTTKGYAE